ncbi:MAG: TIM-barrel domain-containing protein, partial [Bacteroidota bacterium]
WLGDEVTTYKSLFPDERFIGLGEKTGNLDRRGNGYENWNTDAFGYGTGTDPIYSTIPFYIGLHDSMSYGIFMDNSYKSHFNFGASQKRFSSFTAEGGDMNYYFIFRTAIGGIIDDYTYLTGRMTMPALWSIGYQQCRYSYYPQEEVVSIAKTFREKQIPCDVIYLDIHYMDQYKLFTWNPVHFKKPKQMLDELKEMGFHTTVIVDPGIKVEKGYKAYEDGIADDIFVKYPDGTLYSGEVWPGWCHFTDFTTEKGRIWWGKQFTGYVNDGIDGFWNDMNEIATWGQKLPNLMNFGFDGHPTSTMRARNVYGMQMSRATYEGAKKLLGNKRPFVLTRAAYSGIQRYSAIWTGDNSSYDDHMLLGVRLVNSLGLCGVANAGYDIGGFTGGSSPQLFARWMSIASFTPFMRGHSMINSRSCEPWAYGEEVEEISRNYIQLRYKMLPYLYSSFHESTMNGMPVARSLAIDYPYDNKIYNSDYQNQFFFGHGIMVCPTSTTRDLARFYLPAGDWYDFYNDTRLEGSKELILTNPINRLNVFVRGGTIIPMQGPVQNTAQDPGDTLFVHIYEGRTPNSFVYYEDDGASFDYEKGDFFKRKITYDPTKKEVMFGKKSGNMQSKFNYVKVILHGPKSQKAEVNGKSTSTSSETFNMLNPISKFDPIGRAGDQDYSSNTVIGFADSGEEVTVRY